MGIGFIDHLGTRVPTIAMVMQQAGCARRGCQVVTERDIYGDWRIVHNRTERTFQNRLTTFEGETIEMVAAWIRELHDAENDQAPP